MFLTLLLNPVSGTVLELLPPVSGTVLALLPPVSGVFLLTVVLVFNVELGGVLLNKPHGKILRVGVNPVISLYTLFFDIFMRYSQYLSNSLFVKLEYPFFSICSLNFSLPLLTTRLILDNLSNSSCSSFVFSPKRARFNLLNCVFVTVFSILT